MKLLILLVGLSSRFAIGTNLPDVENVQPETIELSSSNLTDDPNKDMYVIHAMVYQVGIITNRTDDEANNTGVIGNQEAVTFYHNNGSQIDLSQIPEALMTNVTAQRLVGVAPAPATDDHFAGAAVSWSELKKLASSQDVPPQSESTGAPRRLRGATDENYGYYDAEEGNGDYLLDKHPYLERLYKRSLDSRSVDSEKTPVKIVSGSAVIPQEAGVQSIGIPSLLTLNNNFSEIPVPIPNISVVHYAKVSTLINHTP